MIKRKEDPSSKRSKREESSEEKKSKNKIHKEDKDKKKEKESKRRLSPTKKLKKTKSYYKSRQGRFNDVVTDASLYEDFHSFLMKEFCEENLEFYRDAVLLERMPSNDTAQILKAAQAICDKYFGFSNGENVVHLDPWQSRLIKDRLKSPNNHIFVELREEIEQLLQTKYIHFLIPAKD